MADSTVRGVFIGQFGAAAGEGVLAIYGLGSCVALVLYEARSGAGGMAHVLLPGPRPPDDRSRDLPAKYADSALEALLGALVALGARPALLRAALVGGARLFQTEMDLDQGVGLRNVESLKGLLKARGIEVVFTETGGDQGRTVLFDLPRGTLRIRTLRGGWSEHPLVPLA